MAAFDFPSSPSPLQEYTPDGTDLTYVWNGYAWVVKSGGTNLDDYLPLIGGNMKGNITFGPNGDASKLQITNATGALTAQGTEPLRFVSSKSTDQYKFATPNGSFNASVSSENLTASRTFKFPDQGGTFALSENFPTNIRFLGPIDVTGTAPASPTAGDIYLNDTAGNAGASWTGLNEEFIALNQLVFFTALSDWVAGGVTDASQYVTIGTQQTVTGQKSFTQNVGIGGTLPASPNISLNADASARLGVNGSVNGRINLRPNGTDVSLEVASGTLNGNIWTLTNNGTIVANSSANATNSPNYKLDATDGSATFADTVQVGGDANSGAETGARVFVGGFQATAATPGSGSRSLWDGYALGNTTPTSRIYTDGSATFAGDVVSGVYAANEDYVALRGGQVEIGRNTPDALGFITGTRYNNGVTEENFRISADGSGTFAGDVGIGGGPTFGSLSSIDRQLNIYDSGSGSVTGISFGGTNSTNYIYAQNGDTTIDLAPSDACGVRIGGATAGVFPDRIARFSVGGLDIGGTLEEDDALIKGNIILNTDGSGEFAGDVIIGTADTFSDTANGVRLLSSGTVTSQRQATQGTSSVFTGMLGDTPTISILADGSASFADGDFVISDETTFGAKAEVYRDPDSIALSIRSIDARTTDTVSIYGNGSATFAGTVKQGTFNGGQTSTNGSVFIDGGGVMTQFEASTTAATNRAFVVYHGNNEQIEFAGDGSASFAGAISSTATNQAFNATATVITGGSFFWARNNVAASDRYYLYGDVDGDSTPKVKLATDGSASFAGDVDVSSKTLSEPGVNIRDFGTVQIRNDGTADALQVYNGGNATSDQVAIIGNDGSATFAARVSGEVTTIPDGAWDLADSNLWQTSSGTLVNPSGTEPGQTGVIYANSDINTWGSYFKFPGGDVPTVPANSIIPYYVVTQNVISMGMATEEIG